MSTEKKNYFLGADQIDIAIKELSDTQERALDLVASAFNGRSAYEPSREIIILTMEVIVSIEDFLEFTTELTSSAEIIEKGNAIGLKIEEAELDELALRSVICRDKLTILRSVGVVLDIVH